MYSALLPMKTFRNFITGERSIFKASTAPSKFYYNLPNTGGALLWMQLTNLENFWYLHRRKNYSNEWIFLEENSFFPLNDYPEFSFFSPPLEDFLKTFRNDFFKIWSKRDSSSKFAYELFLIDK